MTIKHMIVYCRDEHTEISLLLFAILNSVFEMRGTLVILYFEKGRYRLFVPARLQIE